MKSIYLRNYFSKLKVSNKTYIFIKRHVIVSLQMKNHLKVVTENRSQFEILSFKMYNKTANDRVLSLKEMFNLEKKIFSFTTQCETIKQL